MYPIFASIEPLLATCDCNLLWGINSRQRGTIVNCSLKSDASDSSTLSRALVESLELSCWFTSSRVVWQIGVWVRPAKRLWCCSIANLYGLTPHMCLSIIHYDGAHIPSMLDRLLFGCNLLDAANPRCAIFFCVGASVENGNK